jgi:mandelate racemase
MNDGRGHSGERATVRTVRVRPLDLPARRPVLTAAGPITSIPVVLIDIETSDGVIGRAYLRTYTPAALRALATLVEDLGVLVVGTPADSDAVRALLGAELRLIGNLGLIGCALAGFDMALWDAAAKRHGLPLARLLGSEAERVPAYASLRTQDPDSAAAEAAAAVAEGFTACKVKLGAGEFEADRRLVAAVREAAGEADVMADYNQVIGVDEALARADELDALGLAWIEEPAEGDDIPGHARIAAALATPVALGENLDGVRAVDACLSAGACGVLTLDAMRVGGVRGWMQAAARARDHGVPVASHTFPEVSIHLLAATPTAAWLEHLDHLAPIRATQLRVRDGRAEVPDAPGIGLEWDERAIRRLAG